MEFIVIPISGGDETRAHSVPKQQGLDAGELGACWSLENLELSQTFQHWVCLCRRRGLDHALFSSPCSTAGF